MNKNKDVLSKDYSPQKLQTSGVKRVNNVPLIIVVSILAVFVLLIALVANKRAQAQHQVPETTAVKKIKKNTLSLADEVIGNRKMAIIPEQRKEPPLAQEITPTQTQSQSQIIQEPQASETEVERIRQEKTQQFEEAVKAKTSIMVDNPNLNTRERSLNAPEEAFNVDAASAYKEQLMVLQARVNQPMPQTLGGEENESRWHLNSTLRSPNSRYELRAGSVIPGVLISGISSELPGQIISQVSQNVYDTATGKYLLIPQGTKIIGIYSSDVGFGQNSVLVAWQRLIFPDGKALDIGSMPGADSAGLAGFRDQVNHHYARIYGSALLMSGIVGGITYSQNLNQPNSYGYSPPTAGSVLEPV